MAQIGGESVGNNLLCDGHISILRLLVTLIDRKLFANLNKSPLIVVDFLPKPSCRLGSVNFFQISCAPSHSPHDIQPVAPSSLRQLVPMRKLLFVLGASSYFTRQPDPTTA